MKAWGISGLVLAALGLTSAAAFAEDTDYFVIGKLVASSNSGLGFRVYPAPGYTLPKPDACTNNDFAEVQLAGPSFEEKDLMARQLQAAFWSNRKVKLRLDGCGANQRPAYRIVSLHATL